MMQNLALAEDYRGGTGVSKISTGGTVVPFSRSSYSRSSALTSTKDPEKLLQEMYRSQLTDYNQYQKPLIDALAEEAESNDIIKLGDIQAEAIGDRVRNRTERSLSMNNTNLLPSQRKALEHRLNNDLKITEGGIKRAASIAQQEHNTATRTNLMSIAESLQTTGVSGVSAAAKAKAERDAAAAKAKGGMLSQVMSIAGGVVGGIYGGPMGAQLGASLGGMAGGAIGG
ncbi:hypothetical protein [Shewanella gaetbuli]|uniref:Uncharacterized protein n=1 Tax=Shewanella gaetbuli TaxID=220752 RepID=A0A9X2CH14_9GAMM|nr:hypothetical protein [Shewanella gaetbuli]MCL1142983.1 hypothetical protein [Shewanella gaetbuli]